MELDTIAILAQPTLALFLELVTGCVVDDEEDLATVVALHELPQELEERGPIEHLREAERELGGVERDRTEDVRGLARSVGVDARLNPDARPGTMQTAILPEAGFVLEDHDTAAPCSFLADRRQTLGDPPLLGLLVGAREPLAGPLHREAEPMEQPRNVVVVVPDSEPPVNQVADPRPRPDATRVAGRLRPGLDQSRELRVLRRAEPGRWTGGLARPQRLGPGGVVPAKPLVHCRARHLELRRDRDHLPAVDVVPHRLAAPPCSQVSLLLRLPNQRAQLRQLAPRRPFRLDGLARLGRLVLDSEQSHDRLLETDRYNLRPLRSRHNLIDAGGSDLPDEVGLNPR